MPALPAFTSLAVFRLHSLFRCVLNLALALAPAIAVDMSIGIGVGVVIVAVAVAVALGSRAERRSVRKPPVAACRRDDGAARHRRARRWRVRSCAVGPRRQRRASVARRRSPRVGRYGICWCVGTAGCDTLPAAMWHARKRVGSEVHA